MLHKENFKHTNIHNTVIRREDFNILKSINKDNKLHITRPDKGNGIVIMNRNDYINKMQAILNYHTKF